MSIAHCIISPALHRLYAMMNPGRKTIFTATALVLSTIPVYASQALNGMGKALEILMMIGIATTLLTIGDFVIAALNISRKKRGLRNLSIILSLPMLGTGLLAFMIFPAAGFICLALEVVLWLMIYKSWEPQHAESI